MFIKKIIFLTLLNHEDGDVIILLRQVAFTIWNRVTSRKNWIRKFKSSLSLCFTPLWTALYNWYMLDIVHIIDDLFSCVAGNCTKPRRIEIVIDFEREVAAVTASTWYQGSAASRYEMSLQRRATSASNPSQINNW